MPSSPSSRLITANELQQHRSSESCWVALYGAVYDVTSFLSEHPGGKKVILQLAGTDATEEYDPVHPQGTLEESLPAEAMVGRFDGESAGEAKNTIKTVAGNTKEEREEEGPTTLQECLNLDDIEALGTKRLSAKAWAYYFSGSDDLRSKALNSAVYRSILMRPRVFIDCTRCSTATTLLGHATDVPFFVSPAAMARLGHPDGEHGIARACARFGAAQIISNNASQTPEQIVAGASPEQVFGWQLYVQTSRAKSEAMLRRIAQLPQIRFVVLTLDAPVPGKRELDERGPRVGAKLPARSAVTADAEGVQLSASGGVGKALFAGTAPDLTWARTLPWLRQHTALPIVLKGVQTHEDARLAARHAPQVRGLILSNHGGRALDTAPPSLHTLLEIRRFCPEVLTQLDVFVDGGIKRGTDVVKALCLGARGVGLGRAPLYGLGAGGTAGVERVFEILKAEVETAMRLLGVETVAELGRRHVNSRVVEREIYDGDEELEVVARKSKL